MNPEPINKFQPNTVEDKKLKRKLYLKEYNKIHYLNNIDKYKERATEYQKTKKLDRKEYYKAWYKANSEKIRIARKNYLLKNPEKSLNKYRKHNPEKYRIAAKEWRSKNPEKVKITQNKKVLNISNSYIACTLKRKVNEIPKEILETKRLIILLKRELKK